MKKVMTRIREMLTGILNRAKEVLAIDPENRAALKAKRLAEAERKILQDEYFAHADTAMDNLRAAKADGSKNAAALKTEDAAEKLGVRYSINPDYAQDIDEWAEKGRNENRTFVLGKTGDTLQKLGARANDIYMNSSKINTILKEHSEMTLEEIKRIPEILDDPVMVLTSQNKGRTKQNTRLVMFGSVKAQDGRPILCVLDLMPVEKGIAINDMQKLTSAYTKDNNPVGFVRNSTVLYAAENEKRTTTLLRLLGFQLPIGLQRYSSIGSITYEDGTVKFDGVKFTSLEKSRTDEPVKKSIRFQLGAPVEVNGQKDLVAVHNLTEENLREALDLGGAAVRRPFFTPSQQRYRSSRETAPRWGSRSGDNRPFPAPAAGWWSMPFLLPAGLRSGSRATCSVAAPQSAYKPLFEPLPVDPPVQKSKRCTRTRSGKTSRLG